MKKLLFIFGLLFSVITIDAQEIHYSPKRYDFKEVDRFQYDTYTVLVITDCITNEKDYNFRISYDVEIFDGEKVKKEAYFSSGVVERLLNALNYFSTTQFLAEQKGENSFIVYEISKNLYFKFRIDDHRLDLLIDGNHVLARLYSKSTIEEFASLLLKIEKTFVEKGWDKENAIDIDTSEKELLLFEL